VLEDLDDAGAIVCSHQQEWLETSDPRMRQLIVSVMSWLAEIESHNKSSAIRRGMAERKRQGKPVGGRKPGSRDRKRRHGEGYEAAWEPGGPLYEARQAKLAAEKEALLADPVRLHELHRDVECDICEAGVGDPCRITGGRRKGKVTDVHAFRRAASEALHEQTQRDAS
jgi:hypothetical protein